MNKSSNKTRAKSASYLNNRIQIIKEQLNKNKINVQNNQSSLKNCHSRTLSHKIRQSSLRQLPKTKRIYEFINLNSQKVVKKKFLLTYLNKQSLLSQPFVKSISHDRYPSKQIQQTMHFNDFVYSTTLNPQTTKFQENKKQYLNIEKSRTSTKQNGIVIAYGANSFKRNYNIFEQTQMRLSIITNVTKIQTKENQISFYAIYQTQSKGPFIDFIRDNFHRVIVQNLQKGQEINKVVDVSLKTIEYKFFQLFNIKPTAKKSDIVSISFIIVLIIAKKVYLIKRGASLAIISSKLGKTHELNKQYFSVQQISSSDQLDFILIGNQRLTNNFTKEQYIKIIWLEFMKSLAKNSQIHRIFNSHKYKYFHNMAGDITDKVMNLALKNMVQNCSIILLVFNNIKETFQDNGQLSLPYF